MILAGNQRSSYMKVIGLFFFFFFLGWRKPTTECYGSSQCFWRFGSSDIPSERIFCYSVWVHRWGNEYHCVYGLAEKVWNHLLSYLTPFCTRLAVLSLFKLALLHQVLPSYTPLRPVSWDSTV